MQSLILSNIQELPHPWEGGALLRTYGDSAGFASAVVHHARRWATDYGGILGSERDGYEGIATTYDGSVSGGGVGPQLYLPSLLRSYYGWHTSVYLMNSGGQPTRATIYYYDDNGTFAGSTYYDLQPFQRVRWTNSAVYSGSARVVSGTNQPLAATVVQERGSGVYAGWSESQEYPASNRGGPTSYVPSLLRSYYEWTSAYVNRAVGTAAYGATSFYDTHTEECSPQ